MNASNKLFHMIYT